MFREKRSGVWVWGFGLTGFRFRGGKGSGREVGVGFEGSAFKELP